MNPTLVHQMASTNDFRSKSENHVSRKYQSKEFFASTNVSSPPIQENDRHLYETLKFISDLLMEEEEEEKEDNMVYGSMSLALQAIEKSFYDALNNNLDQNSGDDVRNTSGVSDQSQRHLSYDSKQNNRKIGYCQEEMVRKRDGDFSDERKSKKQNGVFQLTNIWNV